jgi:hypothetical protein
MIIALIVAAIVGAVAGGEGSLLIGSLTAVVGALLLSFGTRVRVSAAIARANL